MASELEKWVRAELKRVREAGSVTPWGRNALKKYLGVVYKFARGLRRRVEDSNEAIAVLIKCAGEQRKCSRSHPLRSIIDLTCVAGGQQKSKWDRALQYLWAKNINSKDMPKKMEEAGGMNACADKWARRRRRMKKKK
jgi:hypothetical protein